jgi:SAM-dependent methyltransferase
MYGRSARFYDALYGSRDYETAARSLHEKIQLLRPGARRLLDVGCGTGKHLQVLRQWYEVEGVDLNPDLLAIARDRLGDAALYQQDMVVMDTGRRYDVITCLFSAIAYVRTAVNLRRTVQRFRDHLETDGFVFLEPYFSPEQYWTDRVTLNVVDQPDLKIAWMYTSTPPVDNVATIDIHHLVGTPQGVECFAERHEMGLFTPAEYAEAFERAGFNAEFDPGGFFGRGAYTAVVDRRPGPGD